MTPDVGMREDKMGDGWFFLRRQRVRKHPVVRPGHAQQAAPCHRAVTSYRTPDAPRRDGANRLIDKTDGAYLSAILL